MPEVDVEKIILPAWIKAAPDSRLLQLIGQNCGQCGVTFFPRTARCKACGSANVSEFRLGPDAILHSITTDETGTFLGRRHLVGQVQFREGAFVQGFVDAPLDREPTIGSPVELVPFDVPAPGGEGTLVTYAFRPKGAN